MTEQPGVPPAGAPDASPGHVPVDPPPVPVPPPAAAWAPSPPPVPAPPAAAPASGRGAPAPAPGSAVTPAWGTPAPGATPTWGTPAPVQVMARPKVLARSGMKTTLSVAAIMIGVVLGVNIVNAAVPLPTEYVDPGTNPAIPAAPIQPEPTVDPGQPAGPTAAPPAEPTPAPIEPGPVSGGTTVTINDRYAIVFPDGWALVEEGDDALIFQKGSVTFVVGGTAFEGTVTELAAAYRDVFFQNGNLVGEEPSVSVTTTGIPIAGLNYTGTLQDTQVDGFILVALEQGSGMISNTFGPTGALQGVGNDLSMIINSIKRVGE